MKTRRQSIQLDFSLVMLSAIQTVFELSWTWMFLSDLSMLMQDIQFINDLFTVEMRHEPEFLCTGSLNKIRAQIERVGFI